MSLVIELREWTMWLMEAGILYYVAREFYYDRDKDLAKAQKKTRSSKKTVTDKTGTVTVEESQEITEPMEEKK